MTIPVDMMVRPFRTDQQQYLYCGRSNQIFCVEPVMLEILPFYGEHTLAEIQQRLSSEHSASAVAESYAIIDDLAREGSFFRRGGLRTRIAPISEETLREELAADIGPLLLGVTEACNQRCHYCAYSGGYADDRQHGARTMSRDTAKAAIDFLFAKNRKSSSDLHLGFYGGEPLTAFPLIRFAVEYARSLDWAHPESLSFSLTTNGTLLTDEIMRFFLVHKFDVLVSLDGPAEDHDAHRVRKDGKGTFAEVMARIRRFNELAGGVPATSVNCVLTQTSDLERLSAFFGGIAGEVIGIDTNDVAPGHRTFEQEYPGSPAAQREQSHRLFARYLEAHCDSTREVPARNDLAFERAMFGIGFIKLQKRQVLPQAPDEGDLRPTCMPGKRKAFVDTVGRLHLCERIIPTLPIGDVWNGFDLPAIKRIVSNYVDIMNREECKTCWAVRFCPGCFANMSAGNRLSLERTRALCEPTKKLAESTLIAYCSVIERRADAFDYCAKVRIE
jgi:uncharacterized protein